MKKRKWVKPRHRVFRNIIAFVLKPYIRLKYRIKIEKFKEQQKRPYLILYNHQTPFDQFFVGMAFKGPVYYVASEDIFSLGFVSSVIRYLVAPIPIQKNTTDVRAVMNCIRVAREGGTIAIAPEGNRTYSGETGYMIPTIAPLAKKLNLPIALYRLEGGYGVEPRWSDVVRNGNMRGYVSRVIYPEEYASMSDEELFSIIKSELYVDESAILGEYRHKRRAEYLERALYACPSCGFSVLESNRDVLTCGKCGRSVRYGIDKSFIGIGCECRFASVKEWYNFQEKLMNSIDPRDYTADPIWIDRTDLYAVIPFKNKRLISADAELHLFGDRIEIFENTDRKTWRFEDITATAVLGRNKLEIYYGGDVFQFKGNKRFNALKYVHLYNRYKNVVGGKGNVEFLGL